MKEQNPEGLNPEEGEECGVGVGRYREPRRSWGQWCAGGGGSWQKAWTEGLCSHLPETLHPHPYSASNIALASAHSWNCFLMVPIPQLLKPSLVLSLSLSGGGDSVTSHVSWPRVQTLPASHSPLVGTRLFLKWNRKSYSLVQKPPRGTSLVVQWLRIHLQMQGMWVRSLVGELRSYMPQGNQACTLQIRLMCTGSRVWL